MAGLLNIYRDLPPCNGTYYERTTVWDYPVMHMLITPFTVSSN